MAQLHKRRCSPHHLRCKNGPKRPSGLDCYGQHLGASPSQPEGKSKPESPAPSSNFVFATHTTRPGRAPCAVSTWETAAEISMLPSAFLVTDNDEDEPKLIPRRLPTMPTQVPWPPAHAWAPPRAPSGGATPTLSRPRAGIYLDSLFRPPSSPPLIDHALRLRAQRKATISDAPTPDRPGRSSSPTAAGARHHRRAHATLDWHLGPRRRRASTIARPVTNSTRYLVWTRRCRVLGGARSRLRLKISVIFTHFRCLVDCDRG